MKYTVAGLLGLAMCIVFFQNCSGGFRGDATQMLQLSSQAQGAFGLHVEYESTRHEIGDLAFEVGTRYILTVVNAPPLTVSKQVIESVDTAGCTLEALQGAGDDAIYRLVCSQQGDVELRVEATLSNGKVSSFDYGKRVISVSQPPAPSATPKPAPSNVVEFRIQSGTTAAANDWNTSANPAVVFVGQTLKIINDDVVRIRMHSNGSPCPHQPAPGSDPGQSYDCVVTSAHAATATDIYDHDRGNQNSRRFYVEALNGAALYGNGAGGKNCVGCHGVLANSTKKNASFEDIKAAIANVQQMGSIVITDNQIRAIVYELNKP